MPCKVRPAREHHPRRRGPVLVAVRGRVSGGCINARHYTVSCEHRQSSAHVCFFGVWDQSWLSILAQADHTAQKAVQHALNALLEATISFQGYISRWKSLHHIVICMFIQTVTDQYTSGWEHPYTFSLIQTVAGNV